MKITDQFHALWDQCVGKPNYNAHVWRNLDLLLQQTSIINDDWEMNLVLDVARYICEMQK
jgi:hypothetical protein